MQNKEENRKGEYIFIQINRTDSMYVALVMRLLFS